MSSSVEEHVVHFHGFAIPWGTTTRYRCIACGHGFSIVSMGRVVTLVILAILNFGVAVLLLQILGGPKKALDGDLFLLALFGCASFISIYLTVRVATSLIARRMNPRR